MKTIHELYEYRTMIGSMIRREEDIRVLPWGLPGHF